MTRQMAAACAMKPEPQSQMFAADMPERERTTLGSLRAHGKNARVAVNRASSSASHRGHCHCDVQCSVVTVLIFLLAVNFIGKPRFRIQFLDESIVNVMSTVA